jgi:putative ABC transport system substrate-binding protein
MRRREFIAGLGSVAALPLSVQAQQPALPVVGFISARSPHDAVHYGTSFRAGLGEAGTIDGQSVTVDYHWLDGQYDGLPSLMADLVRRRVAVIATAGSTPAALAAKAAPPMPTPRASLTRRQQAKRAAASLAERR